MVDQKPLRWPICQQQTAEIRSSAARTIFSTECPTTSENGNVMHQKGMTKTLTLDLQTQSGAFPTIAPYIATLDVV